MRTRSFGNSRRAKNGKSSSPRDRRSTSCQSPTRESRLMSTQTSVADRSGDVKASHASEQSNRRSMIWIPGGSFLMGSNAFYREERPVRRETVQGFWMDPYPVTNVQFRKFIDA